MRAVVFELVLLVLAFLSGVIYRDETHKKHRRRLRRPYDWDKDGEG